MSSEQHSVNIETGKAVRSILDLSRSFKEYNSQLNKTTASMKENASAAQLNEKLIKEQSKAAKERIAVMDEMRRALEKNALAADRYRANMAKVGKDVEGANKQAAEMTVQHWDRAINIVRYYVSYRLLRFITSEVEKSLKTISALEMGVSEIRTISQGNQQPFAEWKAQLYDLSDEYGAVVTKVSEGTYQVLSNQVASGAESITFMNEALKASVAFVSSADTAVNLLTAGINAFDLSAEDATAVAASFFKTIELGRVRADDMATSIGRIAPIANTLGITLDELNAGIATMTIQGTKFSVANTQLRSILLKLIKPTDAMKGLFKEWGVETGQEAIRVKGFVGVLRELSKELETGGIKRIGELFGRERPITGLAALLKNDLADYEDTLEKYQDATQDYLKGVDIGFESTAKHVDIELNKLKNHIARTFGQDTLNYFANLSDEAGGLVNIFKTGVTVVKAATAVWIAHRIAVKATALSYAMLEIQAKKTGVAMAEVSASAKLMKGFGYASGVMLALVAIEETFSYVAKINSEWREFQGSTRKVTTELDLQNAKIKQIADVLSKEIIDNTREGLKEITGDIAKLNKLYGKNSNIIKDIARAGEEGFKAVNKGSNKFVSEMSKVIGKLDSAIVKSKAFTQSFESGDLTRSYLTEIVDNIGKVDEAWIESREKLNNYRSRTNSKDPDQQGYNQRFNAFNKLRRQTYSEAMKAFESGDIERGRKLFTESVSMTKKLYDFGVSRDAIMKSIVRTMEKRNQLEKDYQKSQKAKRDYLITERDTIKQALVDLKKYTQRQKELNSEIKRKKKTKPEGWIENETVAVNKGLNQARGVLENVNVGGIKGIMFEQAFTDALGKGLKTFTDNQKNNINELVDGFKTSIKTDLGDGVKKSNELLKKIEENTNLQLKIEEERKKATELEAKANRLKNEVNAVSELERSNNTSTKTNAEALLKNIAELKNQFQAGFFGNKKPIEPDMFNQLEGIVQGFVREQGKLDPEIGKNARLIMNYLMKEFTVFKEGGLKGEGVRAMFTEMDSVKTPKLFEKIIEGFIKQAELQEKITKATERRLKVEQGLENNNSLTQATKENYTKQTISHKAIAPIKDVIVDMNKDVKEFVKEFKVVGGPNAVRKQFIMAANFLKNDPRLDESKSKAQGAMTGAEKKFIERLSRQILLDHVAKGERAELTKGDRKTLRDKLYEFRKDTAYKQYGKATGRKPRGPLTHMFYSDEEIASGKIMFGDGALGGLAGNVFGESNLLKGRGIGKTALGTRAVALPDSVKYSPLGILEQIEANSTTRANVHQRRGENGDVTVILEVDSKELARTVNKANAREGKLKHSRETIIANEARYFK